MQGDSYGETAAQLTMRTRMAVLGRALGLATATAAAAGLVYLCWMLTPALWSGGLPFFVAIGFYGLCGMLIGLLAVLAWQLLPGRGHASHRPREGR